MKWNDPLLDAQRQICDPPADAVISQLVAEFGPDKARELFSQLIHRIDMPFAELPSYVRTYFEQASVLPDGFNPAQVVRGQKVFVDFGPEVALMLYFKSLPTCYLAWKLCETLAITGRLDDTRQWPAVFSRRVGETTQFLLDVMTPGSFLVNGKGIATTLKVRLVHASIRQFVGQSDKYNEALWQKPINQEDLAYTLLTFGLSMIQGMRLLKLPLTNQQAEDFYAAWRLVGHFLGILPEMIPIDLADAEAQQAVMFQRLIGPAESSASITKALLDFSREAFLPGELLDNSPEFLLRYFIGDAHAQVLGIVPNRGCVAAVLPHALAKYMGALEKLEDKGLGLEKLSNRLGMAIIKGLRKRFKSSKGGGLSLSDDLKQSWGLD